MGRSNAKNDQSVRAEGVVLRACAWQMTAGSDGARIDITGAGRHAQRLGDVVHPPAHLGVTLPRAGSAASRTARSSAPGPRRTGMLPNRHRRQDPYGTFSVPGSACHSRVFLERGWVGGEPDDGVAEGAITNQCLSQDVEATDTLIETDGQEPNAHKCRCGFAARAHASGSSRSHLSPMACSWPYNSPQVKLGSCVAWACSARSRRAGRATTLS